MKYDERLRRDQAVARLEANTRRIAADVPVTVTPDDMANEYHWKNPHMVRDGSRFADPAVVEAYAKIADLRERLAAAERERDEAQAAAVRWGVRKREAEAACAAMRTVVETAVASQSWSGDDTREDRWPAFYRAARAALASDHPGADLLAVVEAARKVVARSPSTELNNKLSAALATYDVRVQEGK